MPFGTLVRILNKTFDWVMFIIFPDAYREVVRRQFMLQETLRRNA